MQPSNGLGEERCVKRAVGMVAGLFVALAPVVALASEGGRSLEGAADLGTVVLVTLLALAALAVVISVGYLYRRERGLDWEFQKPDAPDDHH
jgi:hypothetical protein